MTQAIYIFLEKYNHNIFIVYDFIILVEWFQNKK